MDQQTLTIIFRIAGLLFLGSLGVFLFYFLRKKTGTFKRVKQISFGVMLAGLATVFAIMIYTANADTNVQNLKEMKDLVDPNDKDAVKEANTVIDAAKENFIFRDVQAVMGVFVHLAIILSITVGYWYMLRRVKKLPPGEHTNGYKFTLWAGLAFVAGFAGYAIYKCITDADFRGQIYFRTYAFYFVGNIFIMLVASMISAAGMPDEEDEQPGKKSLL
jgi:uncharacterized membrane protein YuzA (DUF378 family)